jgi:hypothetical protein
MFRLKEREDGLSLKEGSKSDTALVGELAFLVNRLKERPDAAKEPLFSQLVRKLENAGYETGISPDVEAESSSKVSSASSVEEVKPTSDHGTGPPRRAGQPRRLEWDHSLADRYEAFGLVENGQMVVIEEEPVFKEGKVIRKGQAVPE